VKARMQCVEHKRLTWGTMTYSSLRRCLFLKPELRMKAGEARSHHLSDQGQILKTITR